MASGVQAICGYAGCEVNELTGPKDHIHLVAMVPQNSISDLVGRIKGQTAMKMFNQYKPIEKEALLGEPF
jgi:putative transposase